MNIFNSWLTNRIAIWKLVWLIFWWVAFFLLPVFLNESDLFLRFWILFWYITLWSLVWIFGIMDKCPIANISLPFWVRGTFLWAWMNFVLVFFVYDKISLLMQGTMFFWYSPFRLVLEWLIFWIIADYFATRFVWEGKKLIV